MRLLFYISSMRAGGAERVMSVLCNGFAERGNDVYLATNTEAPISYRLDEKVHLLDLYPHGYKDMNRYVRFVSLYRSVHRIARRVKPDVIIAFMGMATKAYWLPGDCLFRLSLRNIPLMTGFCLKGIGSE